jgi:hypothetical protein
VTADPLADIKAVVFHPDAARPLCVHVHPGLLHQLGRGSPALFVADGSGRAWPVLLVPDAALPQFPGFEVHREPPR